MEYACIIGSLNTDLVTETDRFPESGETVSGTSFSTFRGGKGGNQTVAMARLGAETAHIGKVGSDSFGTDYLNFFK